MKLGSLRKCTAACVLQFGLLIGGTQLEISGEACAEEWPDRPLTIVVPTRPGGTNDRAARLMAKFLSVELGQPVTIVNKPGGGNMLGHIYFLQQKDDGYTLLRTTAMPFITLNTVLQGAKFKVTDFSPINLPEQGYSLIATSPEKPYKTIDDVIDAIRANPGKISVGGEPTDASYYNFQQLLKGVGLSIDAVRFVTYNSGGPLRAGIMGGQFDIGLTGTQGSEHLIGKLRPLLVFSNEKIEPWNAPNIKNYAERRGFKIGALLRGSLQGYLVHTTLKKKYPKRYARLVQAFKSVSNDPKAIEEHKKARLSVRWVGPDKSKKLMMEQHELLADPNIYNVFKPK